MKTENKPIFLSIGYAAFHWCHVMAHESFEDITCPRSKKCSQGYQTSGKRIGKKWKRPVARYLSI
ncbi:MAG: DUF255 domain-containing protein [Anaerolineae bacterium]|nr:DUF255 domain-containing protein [Anaerolineae bacterium]